jgi:hypothetical protein
MGPNVRLWVSAAWVLLTAVMLVGMSYRPWWRWKLPPKNNSLMRVLTVAWILGPPLWFIVEFGLLWDGKHPSPEDFKYGQELARNVWIAVAAALGALLGFDLRGGKAEAGADAEVDAAAAVAKAE